LAAGRHRRQFQRNPTRPDAGYWSSNQFGYPAASAINSFGADLVHLHWIGDNFLPIAELARIQTPIVWTLHDMWALTGGCHYAGECRSYGDGCGHCPQLREPRKDDLSAKIARQKKGAWQHLPFTVVCPSQWLADCAAHSSLLRDKRIQVIANPIDHDVFKPLDKTVARRAFNLPLNSQLVLFGAFGGTSDPRKGFAKLRAALAGLDAESGIELVVFGGEATEKPELDFPTHQIGQLRDEHSLSLLYNACDAYVLPALQDNLPNTLMEALACGTPCVAFDTGGVADLVQHQQNGYLAKPKDPFDMLSGIEWTLSQAWYADALHQQSLERYSFERISEQYLRLYQSLSVKGST
jgi:glycosyltransferase involved in cell wall biosynthesis